MIGLPFWQRYIEIDLARALTHEREMPLSLYEHFYAGSGLAAAVMSRWSSGSITQLADAMRSTDPLGPESAIIFSAGLLTGTPIPTACKLSICFRSPLTGLWCESTVGGHFAARLKFCGVDGLVVSGKAREPVYLVIDEGRVEFRPARHLWGRTGIETSALVKREVGDDFIVCAIGPAGENLVPFASITFDGATARAAGRGGGGAVLGSKRVKAIAVRGSRRPALKDPGRLKLAVARDNAAIRKAAATLAQYSTAGGVERHEHLGNLPIKNWSLGSWPEGASKTAAQYFLPRTFVRHYACFACPIGCGKIVKISRECSAGGTPVLQYHVGHAPEYEACAGFGANCLNDNHETVFQANLLCDELGLDTISTSNVIAFAMEAFEKGKITVADTDGLELHWGSGKAILELIRRIAVREGIGALLSQGVRKAAQVLGLEDCAVHVKGLEMAYHDPRAHTDMAVNYATANRGACHLESLGYFLGGRTTLPGLGYPQYVDRHSNTGKGKVTFDMQNYVSVFNALGICKFLLFAGVDVPMVAEWVALATGWETTVGSLLTTGERIFNLKRLCNVACGVTRKDDTLPPRLLRQPRPDGGSAGVLPDLEPMLQEYYDLRGWDEGGVPTAERLAKLGLTPGPGP